MPNSIGKTDKDVRRFLRKNGVKVTADNVDRIGREIRRTQNENEMVERISDETGNSAREHARRKAIAEKRVRDEMRRRG